MSMTGQHQSTTEGRPQVLRSDTPRRRVRDFTESKNGFKTTEFMMTAIFVVGVLVATYLDSDSLARSDGWRYASFAVIAYSVSRGLAKLGVSEPYNEDVRD